MEHKRYITRKRARFKGICGPINIPFGTSLEARDGFLFMGESCICASTSQNAYDHFSQDDDGHGLERGGLVTAIQLCLEKKDAKHQDRWNSVWESQLCQKYRRSEHEDHWIWNYAFFNAPVEELRHIAALVGAKV